MESTPFPVSISLLKLMKWAYSKLVSSLGSMPFESQRRLENKKRKLKGELMKSELRRSGLKMPRKARTVGPRRCLSAKPVALFGEANLSKCWGKLRETDLSQRLALFCMLWVVMKNSKLTLSPSWSQNLSGWSSTTSLSYCRRRTIYRGSLRSSRAIRQG